MGTQNDLEHFTRHAPGFDVVMISNMDGHAEHDLEEGVVRRFALGLIDIPFAPSIYNRAVEGAAAGLQPVVLEIEGLPGRLRHAGVQGLRRGVLLQNLDLHALVHAQHRLPMDLGEGGPQGRVALDGPARTRAGRRRRDGQYLISQQLPHLGRTYASHYLMNGGTLEGSRNS
jgi:hypothetical protein